MTAPSSDIVTGQAKRHFAARLASRFSGGILQIALIVVAAAVSAAKQSVNGNTVSGTAAGAEELILQQLQLMAHQLETLRAGALQPQP